jgi:hypothetical protein
MATLTDPADKKLISVRQQVVFLDSDTLLIENFNKKDGVQEKKSIQYKYMRRE